MPSLTDTQSSTELVIIAAFTASGRVIGQNGKIPWHLPEDLKRFRQITTGYPIIMGRKTWETCLDGRSLPQRHSIVVSRALPASPPQAQANPDTTLCVVSSLDEAIAQVQSADCAFIIGGASIYAQTLAIADRLELSLVQQEVEGDAFFPADPSWINQHFCQVDTSEYPGFWTETYQRLT
ncbi:MAG: dihydrofolate reductase [Elainellaceae cyanobacterium]